MREAARRAAVEKFSQEEFEKGFARAWELLGTRARRRRYEHA